MSTSDIQGPKQKPDEERVREYYTAMAEQEIPDKPTEVKARWVRARVQDYNSKIKKKHADIDKVNAFLQEQKSREYKPPSPQALYVLKNLKGLRIRKVQSRTIGALHPRDRTAHTKGTE